MLNFIVKLSDILLSLLVPASVISIVLIIISLPIYFLWNWLIPSLFKLRHISIPEAFGILVLCKLLFGKLKIN